MTAPGIGVTGMWSNQVHGLRFAGSAVAVAVLRSVVRAGGEPLTLFTESTLDPRERVRGLDGILVPGGADLLPATYGAEPAPETRPADHDGQDEFEATIIRAAIAEGVPVLAICRGFQLINAMHGGTLVQHVGDETNLHRNGMHDVEVAPGSVLHSILGTDRLTVSSYHHQAVDRTGAGLTVTAVAPDGVVEGVEVTDSVAPVVAVQWHPEDNADTDPRQHALFAWLVDQARVQAQAQAQARSGNAVPGRDAIPV